MPNIIKISVGPNVPLTETYAYLFPNVPPDNIREFMHQVAVEQAAHHVKAKALGIPVDPVESKLADGVYEVNFDNPKKTKRLDIPNSKPAASMLKFWKRDGAKQKTQVEKQSSELIDKNKIKGKTKIKTNKI